VLKVSEACRPLIGKKSRWTNRQNH